MATGLLIRVGMDSTDVGGKGYSFCKTNGEFFYLPIPEDKNGKCSTEYERLYDTFKEPLYKFIGKEDPKLPPGGQCHLDPDFEHLTYGDTKGKASRIKNIFLDENLKLKPNSFIAFYAALKPIDEKSNGQLVYALIGFYWIESIRLANEIAEEDRDLRDMNAHTRSIDYLNNNNGEDVIVFARKDGNSGRLEKYIEIGELRHKTGVEFGRKMYRVKKTILEDWGGLSVSDGYLQRSVYLPEFRTSDKFLRWFQGHNPILKHENNLQ